MTELNLLYGGDNLLNDHNVIERKDNAYSPQKVSSQQLHQLALNNDMNGEDRQMMQQAPPQSQSMQIAQQQLAQQQIAQQQIAQQQMQQQQMQQQQLQQQQMQQQQMQQQQKQRPRLSHPNVETNNNVNITDNEDDNIATQDLTQDEIEGLKKQLDLMQMKQSASITAQNDEDGNEANF